MKTFYFVAHPGPKPSTQMHRWRNRWYISDSQREALHDFYRNTDTCPDKEQILTLAKRIRLSPTRVNLWLHSQYRVNTPWFKNKRDNNPVFWRLAAVLVCVYTDSHPDLSLCEASSMAWNVLHGSSLQCVRRTVDALVYDHINRHSALLLVSHPSLTSADTHALAVRTLSERSEALSKWM